MKKRMLLLGVALCGALASLSVSAESQRVVVFMKSKDLLNKARNERQHKEYFSRKGLYSQSMLPQSSVVRVHHEEFIPLENMDAVIMTVSSGEDFESLQKNQNVLMVDHEVIHPLPESARQMLQQKGTRRTQDVALLNAWMMGGNTPWGITAVRAIGAWGASAKGANARVLVLDSGIDKNHRFLRSNFETGMNFAPHDPRQPKVVDPNDLTDEVGHGTHVSGTIAGVEDGTGFTGVAPRARLLMGRVCYVEGCSSLAIVQGLNYAVAQKVDVVNMSLGGSMATPSERRAISKVLQANIPVVAASGNNGEAQVSYPAALSGVIAIGAVDSSLKKASFSQWGPELALVGPGVDVLSTVPAGQGMESVVTSNIDGARASYVSTTFEGAKKYYVPSVGELVDVGFGTLSEFQEKNVQGKTVLVSRGMNPIMEKITNAVEAGAKDVLLYNNQPGLLRGSLTSDGSELSVGVFMIEQNSGASLKQALKSGKSVTMTLSQVFTDYAVFSGTSMATPHVAGVVALMKSANKKLTPDQVKTILQQTAMPLTPNGQNELGAGLVNAEAAVRASLPTPLF